MKAKNILLALTAIVISSTAFSQSEMIKKDSSSTTTSDTSSTRMTTATTSTDATFPKPNHGRYYIAVLGTYQSGESAAEAKSVTITADETNPGKVWIEGLTEEKIYALLKEAPGTYKIPVQQPSDKPVAEGEVRYDENSKSISICVGCGFNKATSTEVPPVATSMAKNTKTDKSMKKTKSSIISFTGIKTDNGSVSIR